MRGNVKKYIQEGIHFSNEIMDAIEDISQKYQEHISISMEIGHFDKMCKIMMKISKTLIEYNNQYTDLIRDYEKENENEKGLETIPEE
jgi:ABC-type polysaccharide/polyol phosphate transport system ATPase subunit